MDSVWAVETGDEVLAVAAAARLKWIRTDRWPLVAAHLGAAGVDGDAVLTLAGLARSVSGWEVDQLVPKVLEELGAPVLTDAEAVEVLVRVLAQRLPDAGVYAILRDLAELAPGLDYPGGLVGRAYAFSEWLDCSCPEGAVVRAEAAVFEAELRALPPLKIDVAFAAALGRHWLAAPALGVLRRSGRAGRRSPAVRATSQ